MSGSGAQRNSASLTVRRKLLYSAIILGFFVGGAEVLCRLLGLGAITPVEDYIGVWNRSPDGRAFWAFHGKDFNEDGMRDQVHAVEGSPGVRRIACIGDSVVMGYGLTRREAIPYFLEQRMNGDGQHVEVFNIAIPGWSTQQHVHAYRKIARKYDPDLVLLGVCLNDIPEMHNNLVAPPPAIIGFMIRNSALVRWLVDAEGREVHRIEELFIEPPPPAVQSGYRGFVEELRTLRDEVKADRKHFAVVVFPFRLQLHPDAPPPRPQQAIDAIARSNGIRMLDVLPVLRQHGTDAFVDESHLSARGAQIVADHVYAWLQTWWIDE